MSSACRRSERALAELALTPLGGRDDLRVLVAGLGVGHTLRAVLDWPGLVSVDVVEISDAVVEWNRRHFAALNGNALEDPRVRVHTMDLARFIGDPPSFGEPEGWLALLLDVDNGPSWPARAANAALYEDAGLAELEGLLQPGGVIAVWSAQREADFARRLGARFAEVAELPVPAEVGGQPAPDYIYRGRRHPTPG
jgi:spermidine synthase